MSFFPQTNVVFPQPSLFFHYSYDNDLKIHQMLTFYCQDSKVILLFLPSSHKARVIFYSTCYVCEFKNKLPLFF